MAGKLSNIKIKELPEIKLGGGIDLDLDNIHLKELPEIKLAGGLDFKLNDIRLKELAPISIGITELPIIRLESRSTLETDSTLKTDNTLKSDSKLQTDNKLESDNKVELDIRVRELPQLDFQLGFRPMRLHFPLGYRFCLSLFGVDVLKIETCGEGMVVVEDYEPRPAEQCE